MLKSIHPFAQYLLSLAAVVVAYGIYAMAVVPIIEGPPIVSRQRPIGQLDATPHPDRSKTELSAWLPAGSWELESCKTLETSQGTIYFKDYMPRDDGVLEVFPFTMVFRNAATAANASSAATADAHPVILQASQRAELQFERRVSLTAGGGGRILGGQLKGSVHLFRMPSSPEETDGFSVWTSNVQMSPQRVTTLEQVEFQFGNHAGRGRNLKIDLAHKTPLDAINTDCSKINGVRRVELAFLESLRLEAKASQVMSGDKPGSSPLEITCNGPFVFDFDRQVASFSDTVIVKEIAARGGVLSGDQLDLQFDRELADGALNGLAKSDESAQLNLRKVTAIGRPAQVRIPSQNVDATAERLEYDLATQQLIGSDSNFVDVRQANQQIRSRQLQYRVRDDGSIGTLVAEGPGRFVRETANSDQEGSAATVLWQDRLTIEQVADGKLITVHGAADVQLDKRARITGDVLKMLLAEQQVQIAGETEWDYQPVQLVVTGDVAIETPDLFGKTKTLTANWTRGDQLVPIERRSELQKSTREANWRIVANGAPFTGAVGDELVSSAHAPLSNGTTPAIKSTWTSYRPTAPIEDQKLQFSGNAVTATLSQVGGQTQIERLEIDGNVLVNRHDDNAQSNNGDLNISGGHLVIVPQPNDLHRFTITHAAKVVTRQMELGSDELQLDQTANRIWSTGAGRARVQGTRKNADQTEKGPGPVIDIDWKGGMIFDGEKVYFEHEVQTESNERRADGTQTLMRSYSEGLNLILERRVDLQQSKNSAAPANNDQVEVRQIVFVDRIPQNGRAFDTGSATTDGQAIKPVVLQKTTMSAAGQPIDKQLMMVPRIVMERASGNINANGPGKLIQWKASSQKSSRQPTFLQASTGAAKNSNSKSKGIDYLQANFDGTLAANANTTEMRITQRVRILYGSVANWEQQLDPDGKSIAPEATKITCEQLDVVQWTPRGTDQPTTEVLATQNARIINQSFEATADRLSYNEQTDMMVIEGDSRQDANLWFQQKPGAPRDHLVAGKILYRPGDQWTQIEKVRNATINQSNSPKNGK